MKVKLSNEEANEVYRYLTSYAAQLEQSSYAPVIQDILKDIDKLKSKLEERGNIHK